MASTKQIITPVIGEIKYEILLTEKAVNDIKTWLDSHKKHYDSCRYNGNINFIIKYNKILEDLESLENELRVLKMELKNYSIEYGFRKSEVDTIEAMESKPEKGVNYTDSLLSAGENIRQYVVSEWS